MTVASENFPREREKQLATWENEGGRTASRTKMSTNAGVWIDHRKARIMGSTPDSEVTLTILSNVEKHPERSGDSPMQGSYESQQVPADNRRQRALTGDLNRYYDTVIEALGGYEHLLIMGPGEAKGELHARMLRGGRSEKRIAALETAGRMTDRQFAAKVKAHFASTAPPLASPDKITSGRSSGNGPPRA